MIALDTNLLVYAHLPHTPKHLQARQVLEQAFSIGPCGTALTNLSEFWAVVTQEKSDKKAVPLSEPKAYIQALVEDGPLKIWHPTIGFYQRLIETAERFGICGVKIFDLQIGLLALENSATEIWTCDRKFIQLPGLRVYDPMA